MTHKILQLQFVMILLLLTNSINTSDKSTFGCIDRLRSLGKQNKVKQIELPKTAESNTLNSIVPGSLSSVSPSGTPRQQICSRLLNLQQMPPMLSLDGHPKARRPSSPSDRSSTNKRRYTTNRNISIIIGRCFRISESLSPRSKALRIVKIKKCTK